jgi:nitroreductase
MTDVDLRSNETIKTIMGRRSVRTFEARPVDEGRVRVILECAFASPSSKNLRPCHVILIDDKKTLEAIGGSSPASRAVGGTPLAVAVCADVAHYEREYGMTDGTWMEDCSCVMMNILTASRALGLEGFWFQVVNRPEKEAGILPILRIPEGVKVFAIAVLGFSGAGAPHGGISEARLHKNGW